MSDHNGIVYEPEDKTERRAGAELHGATLELVRVPPVPHAFASHSSRHQLMFTERGTRRDGESKAEGSQASTLRDTSGTFSIIPAFCSYVGWTEPADPADYLAISLDPVSPIAGGATSLAVICKHPQLYRHDMPVDVVETVRKVRRLILTKAAPDVLRSETLLTLLVQELRDWLTPETAVTRMQRGGLAPWQERLATEMLAARLEGGIGVVELAQACGLSTDHFSLAFRQSLGVPPHRWLTARRMDLARELLARTDAPLADVALRCGFSSQSHLGRMFLATTGEPPASWRRSRRRTPAQSAMAEDRPATILTRA